MPDSRAPRVLHPALYLGTSSWSSKDWEGIFYPRGTAPGDYLAHYATRYRTVEVDATFYRVPSESMTRRWRSVLPDGFLLAAKVPREITHERVMEDCGDELKRFLVAMDHLEDRLGPLLFQFPYFNKASGMTAPAFLKRLGAFLPTLPEGYRFALEIRNKGWLKPDLTGLLRDHGVALTLIDHPWMPRIEDLMTQVDPVTSSFAYLRWLGDRKGIEKVTKIWDKTIVDRERELHGWLPAIRTLLSRNISVFGFFNNHYAGHAPGSIELFERLWDD